MSNSYETLFNSSSSSIVNAIYSKKKKVETENSSCLNSTCSKGVSSIFSAGPVSIHFENEDNFAKSRPNMWGVLISLSDSITYIGAACVVSRFPHKALTHSFQVSSHCWLSISVLSSMGCLPTIREVSVLWELISVDRKQVSGRPANYQDYWPLATFCWRSQLGGSLGYYVAYTWFVSEIL